MKNAGATVVDVRLPKWLLEAKGEFYNAIRYPEFTVQIADYLRTLGPKYPKNIDQLIAQANEFNALRPDGAGPNPNRWTESHRGAHRSPSQRGADKDVLELPSELRQESIRTSTIFLRAQINSLFASM